MKILAIRLLRNYFLNWIQKYLVHMHGYDVYVYLGKMHVYVLDLFTYLRSAE